MHKLLIAARVCHGEVVSTRLGSAAATRDCGQARIEAAVNGDVGVRSRSHMQSPRPRANVSNHVQRRSGRRSRSIDALIGGLHVGKRSDLACFCQHMWRFGNAHYEHALSVMRRRLLADRFDALTVTSMGYHERWHHEHGQAVGHRLGFRFQGCTPRLMSGR
ncbi:uncharacterized protein M421DRAFT_408664 [Didymella exigua CBS 183.55]|uniref:Uncharacterized protein n=1 Tax=Didymella exigua CBS 183.55 TaxID=1150837 RepID=A0A6A5RUE8_9PLEO|nr:uncharacterized protein M421DRAFT_408664 [Didymella exigua CBS 183.55]KAF1931189.1 hypothetical protein M421DRAFT_408664 [Didymella exigua CBS 183.55]